MNLEKTRKAWVGTAAGLLVTAAVLANHAGIQLISRGWTWQESSAHSRDASVSPDGNFIGFTYQGDDLSPNDNNLVADIYLHDRTAETCVLVSTTPAGQSGNGPSGRCSVSQDGRFVAFQSDATNLVDGDTNDRADIFVKDMATGVVERVSVAMGGWESNGSSANPSISADGRYVAFESEATNLVPGDTNGVSDVFVYDRRRRRTSRVSVSDAGIQGNGNSQNARISGDGLWVVFDSLANNLVNNDANGTGDVFIRPTARVGIARLSVSAAGVEGNGLSSLPAVSSDGRYVAFQSLANNLVPNDTNGVQDIFRVDRETGTITRASVNTAGVEANDMSNHPVVDDSGRVFFSSLASNLEGDDVNFMYDIFVRAPNPLGGGDWTVMISRTPDNNEGNGGSARSAISADGRLIAFESDASDLVHGDNNGVDDIFFRTLGNDSMGPMRRASVASAYASIGNNESGSPDISNNGRFVVFSSRASNLVPDDNNHQGDIFLIDRWLGEITRVSVTPDGADANGESYSPRISSDGDTIVFTSFANNLVEGDLNLMSDVFLKSRQTGLIYQVLGHGGVQPNDACLWPAAANGYGLAFTSYASNLVAGDLNGLSDVFYTDVITREIEMISVGPAGQGNGSSREPSITPDGRYVVFASNSSNLVDGGTPIDIWQVYLRDRTTATTTLISSSADGNPGHGDSLASHISDDGRYITFDSEANNLVPDDTNAQCDVFVFDRETNTMIRASVNANGDQANGPSYHPRISSEGRYVTFDSAASNLVVGDTNGLSDVFVRDLRGNRIIRVSMGGQLGRAEPTLPSLTPVISSNGRHVVFMTEAALRDEVDNNEVPDIYLALNYQSALAPGMTFPLSPGEVEGLADPFFNSRPKVALLYNERVKFKDGARKSVKLRRTNYPAMALEGEWKSRIALLSPRAQPWNAMYCREAMDRYFLAGQAVIGNLLVGITQADGTRLVDADAGVKAIVPPEISLVIRSVGGRETDTVQAGDEIQVTGGFFGSKPKVWLEYFDARGRLKQLRCRIFPGRQDVNNKNSCMAANGNSNMWVTVPARWPKGWVHGRHDLVIDNGCGRGCVRLITSP